jgi:hypothetical protein
MGGRFCLKTSVLTAIVLAVLAGCSASDKSPASTASSPDTAPRSADFTSQKFSLPFTIVLPAGLNPQPSEDTKTLISWAAVSGQGGTRFLLPVVVYHPDSTTPKAPPTDYPTYLRGLVSAGATISDVRTTTVGGHAATLLTGTTSRALDGTLGCPGPTTRAEVCFGLQPELVLRIAIIDSGGTTLLAWARAEQGDAGAPKFFADFETMLQSLKLT